LEAFSGTPPDYLFPAVDIVQWRRFDDWPHEEDVIGLGLSVRYHTEGNSIDVHWDEGDVHFYDFTHPPDGEISIGEAISPTARGDKLYGWPCWNQSADFPVCPICNRETEYMLQIDSEDNLPYMFGDAGCGRVSYCPDHPHVLAFDWDCG
jgi:hypothetical protein